MMGAAGRRYALLLALGAVAACGGPKGGGLVVSPDTPEPLAAVLVEMPAATSERESELAAALYEQGEPALGYLVGRLGRPAADDDAAARYAIEAVTRWAGRPGRDRTRSVWASWLAAQLAPGGDVEANRFLLAQLERVGGADEAPTIAALLGEPELHDDAVRALTALGGESARAAILDALEATGAEPSAALARAAGRLSIAEGSPMLRAALVSDVPGVREAAASALADLADPDAAPDLADALRDAEPADRHALAAATLRYAVRVENEGVALRSAQAVLETARTSEDDALLVGAVRTIAALSPQAAREALVTLDPADDRTARELARVAAAVEAEAAVCERARAEAEEGFVPLFNGEDFTGWIGATDGYFVAGGAIVCDPETGGNLYTEGSYSDFVLRFEFRLTPGANNGLGIRAPLEGDAAYVGMELQVLDNRALRHADLRPYQYHGSIYGVAAAERGHQRPVGEWNEQEVVADGRRVRVSLNGAVILDVDLDEVSTPETADGRDHPGLARDAGHIGFLGHGSRVEFRDVRIRELE